MTQAPYRIQTPQVVREDAEKAQRKRVARDFEREESLREQMRTKRLRSIVWELLEPTRATIFNTNAMVCAANGMLSDFLRRTLLEPVQRLCPDEYNLMCQENLPVRQETENER